MSQCRPNPPRPAHRTIALLTHMTLLFAISQSAVARAENPDPARFIPGTATAYVEWEKLSGETPGALSMAVAAMNSPFAKTVFASEFDSVAAVVRIAEQTGRYPGGAAIVPHGKDSVGLLVIVRAGAGAREYAALLTKASDPGARKNSGRKSAPPRSTNADVSVLMGDDATLAPLGLGADWVLFANDPAILDAVKELARNKGKGALAENAELAHCRSKLKPAPGWRLTFWADFAATFQFLTQMESPHDDFSPATFFKFVGLDSARSIAVQFDDTPDGARMTTYTHISNFTSGMARAYRQTPLTDADLAYIPADASWAYTWNLDLKRLYDDVLGDLEKTNEEMHQEVVGALATGRQIVGYSLEDLLGCFGDTWLMYDTPSHGGVLFTGVVIEAELKNADGLQQILARLVQMGAAAAQLGGVQLKVKEMQDNGHTIRYLLASGWPSPIAPAWGVFGDRFVFSLFPQTTAVALRQVDPVTRKGTLLDHPDYQKTRPLLNKELTALWYSDARGSHQFSYALSQLVRTAVAGLTDGDPRGLDLANVPAFPESLAKTHSIVGGYSVDAEGALYVAYGGATETALLDSASTSTAAAAVGILLPSLMRAREVAKRTVSTAQLRQIGMAVHIYAADHGDKFPADLDTVLQEQMITPEMLMSPRDPEASPTNPSYVYIGGQSAAGNPQNVLAYEKLVGEEGLNVLFVDAHVEWMTPEAFEKALAETKERLGAKGESSPKKTTKTKE